MKQDDGLSRVREICTHLTCVICADIQSSSTVHFNLRIKPPIHCGDLNRLRVYLVSPSLFFGEVKYIANGIYKFTQVLTIFGTKLIKLAAGQQIINSNSTKKRFTVA